MSKKREINGVENKGKKREDPFFFSCQELFVIV